MRFQKLILGVILVFAAAVHAQDFKCPSNQGKSPLFNAAVFDGPPAEKAELAPDVSRGKTSYTFASWDVGYLYGMGHTVYLVCKFTGLGDAQDVTIKVEKKVRQCVFRADKGVPAEALCK
jgi:hypothetical protein